MANRVDDLEEIQTCLDFVQRDIAILKAFRDEVELKLAAIAESDESMVDGDQLPITEEWLLSVGFKPVFPLQSYFELGKLQITCWRGR
jgi:hypothetical protein